MGKVYKAHDTRLHRTVAIKILPPDIASDPERRHRFQREAQVIAALNHPHICVLHDVGAHEEIAFLLLVYVPRASLSTSRQLLVVDRRGAERPLPAAPNNSYQQVRLSPDGTRLALSAAGQIWTWTFDTDTLMQLTNDAATHRNPGWAGNTTPRVRLQRFGRPADHAEVGRRGRQRRARGTGAGGIPQHRDARGHAPHLPPPARVAMIMPLAPAGAPRPLLPDARGQSSDVELSPDGRWIAYESNESWRFEVYVRPFPDVSGGRWQLSSGGGQHPLWSRDGRELFFIAADGMQPTE